MPSRLLYRCHWIDVGLSRLLHRQSGYHRLNRLTAVLYLPSRVSIFVIGLEVARTLVMKKLSLYNVAHVMTGHDISVDFGTTRWRRAVEMSDINLSCALPFALPLLCHPAHSLIFLSFFASSLTFLAEKIQLCAFLSFDVGSFFSSSIVHIPGQDHEQKNC